VERVVYGTREGQTIEAAAAGCLAGLARGKFSYRLQDGDQALAVENPYGQVNAVLARILGLNQSVASLEAMTRTLGGAVAGHEAARPAPPGDGRAGRGVERGWQGSTAAQAGRCPGHRRHAHTPDRNRTARKWRSWAAPIRSGRIRAPPPRGGIAVSATRGPDRNTPHAPAGAPAEAAVRGVAGGGGGGEALAAPPPTAVVFPWLRAKPASATPTTRTPGSC